MKKNKHPSNTLMNASLLLLTLNCSNFSFAAVDAANAVNLEFVTAKQLEDSIQLNQAYEKYQQISEQNSESVIGKLSKTRLNELDTQVFRNGVKVDNDTYPQESKLALINSVVKALSNHDYQYFFAHLVMPENGTVYFEGVEQEEYNKLIEQVSELKADTRERLINDYKAIAVSLQNETETSFASAISNAEQSQFNLSINGCFIAGSINTCYNYRTAQGHRHIILEQAGRFYLSGV